ncbi:hypothetical protein LCGC14_2045750 [marine sediment metagenome]|uniref:Uncharacterized protein n=1 Tax=marine sediment metagenome TaxID=412755 RepID=A0A0F9H3Y6_9ZZZZ
MINWRPWIVGLVILAIFVRFPDIAIPQVWDSSTEYAEDDEYDESFLGPLPFCVRDDGNAAKASDGNLQPFVCDSTGALKVTGGGGGAVTNAGTFVVQEDGAALTALQKIDDMILGNEAQVDVITSALPTGASTSAKQLADGHNVTIDNASIAVTGTFFQGTQPISGTVTAGLSAGLLNANSPVTLIDTFSLFDGSGETQIATTNLGASKAYSIPGTGRIVQVCIIISLGTPFGEDLSVLFFDANPSITIEDASLTLAASQNLVNIISLSSGDFRDNFATTKTNCQATDEHYVAITHIAVASEGATTYDDEDIEIRLWYRRDS